MGERRPGKGAGLLKVQGVNTTSQFMSEGLELHLNTHIACLGQEPGEGLSLHSRRAGVSEKLGAKQAWELKARLTKDRGPHCCPQLPVKPGGSRAGVGRGEKLFFRNPLLFAAEKAEYV